MDLLFHLQYRQAKIFKSQKSERGWYLLSVFKFIHYQQNRATINK